MKIISHSLLLAFALSISTPANAAGSLLRIACEGDAAGAEVYIAGKFRGECPVDIQVAEGMLPLRVVKIVDAQHERVFEQDVRIGEGTIKKVEAVLSEPRLNAAAQKLQDNRLAAEKAEMAKREAMREEKIRAELDAVLAVAREQGAEVGNGKSFRECADCPAMVLIAPPEKETVAIGQFEITRAQFAAYVSDTKRVISPGCTIWNGGWITNPENLWETDMDYDWKNPGFKQGEDHPVVCVPWAEAVAYAEWLSKKTGHNYKILNAAWSDYIRTDFRDSPLTVCEYANAFDKTGDSALSVGLGEPWPCTDGYPYTSPVGTFKPNKWGMYDVDGNAGEWLEDKYHGYEKWYPNNNSRHLGGSSWTGSRSGGSGGGGVFWEVSPGGIEDINRRQDIGFRVMRYLISQ